MQNLLHFSFLLAAVCLMATAGCTKKASDTPTPADTTHTGQVCKPLEVVNLADSAKIYAYTYDAQGRIVTYSHLVYSGTDQLHDVGTVTYEGENIITHVASFAGSAYDKVNKYVISGGKIQYVLSGKSLQTLDDTVYYTYKGSQFTKWTKFYPTRTRPEVLTDSVGYQDGLPVLEEVSYRDSTGRNIGGQRIIYTYDTKVVPFNVFSPFVIFPGFEYTKVNRMYTQVKTISTGLDGLSRDSATAYYTTVYDAMGNPAKTSAITGSSAFPNYNVKFKFVCQ